MVRGGPAHGHHHGRGPDEALRRRPGRRRPQLRDLRRLGDRLPRPQRRREDDDAAHAVGLVTPDRGRATIEKRRYAELDEPARVVGALLEATSFHSGRSARNHLRMVARAGGLPDRRADEVLEQVGLADAARRRVGGFSLGMRQRLGLATALLGEPEVLILDEPTNGLDPAGVRWLRDLLRAMAAEGRTVLVSSHLLSEVARTVDRVVVIDRGQLVAEGAVTDLTLAGESLEDAFLRLTNLSEVAR